jgi:hypothetical protein
MYLTQENAIDELRGKLTADQYLAVVKIRDEKLKQLAEAYAVDKARYKAARKAFRVDEISQEQMDAIAALFEVTDAEYEAAVVATNDTVSLATVGMTCADAERAYKAQGAGTREITDEMVLKPVTDTSINALRDYLRSKGVYRSDLNDD